MPVAVPIKKQNKQTTIVQSGSTLQPFGFPSSSTQRSPKVISLCVMSTVGQRQIGCVTVLDSPQLPPPFSFDSGSFPTETGVRMPRDSLGEAAGFASRVSFGCRSSVQLFPPGRDDIGRWWEPKCILCRSATCFCFQDPFRRVVFFLQASILPDPQAWS